MYGMTNQAGCMTGQMGGMMMVGMGLWCVLTIVVSILGILALMKYLRTPQK